MTSSIKSAPVDQQEKYVARKLYTLRIKDVAPDPNQPRKSFDGSELNGLAESIKKYGVLQPVLFRQDEGRNLILVAGERRYQASMLAKLDTIPAIFTEGNATEIALIENLLRVDLTPLEEAEGLQRLLDEANYKNKDLAVVIGKAESTVSEILSLNKLPEKIKEKVRDDKVYSRRQLVEVAKGKDDKEMTKLFKALAKKNMSRDQLREGREKSPRPAAEDILMTMITRLTDKLREANFDSLDRKKANDIKLNLIELGALIGVKVN